VRDYFEIENTPPTHNPELGNGPKIGDSPDLPLDLKCRIFEYLDIKDINKMKDVSHTFIDYVQFHNFQLSKQIKKCLDEIIIRPQRQQKNEHKLLLKNRVRYKRAYNNGGGKVVSGMGYIVKVTPKTVSIVLDGNCTSPSPSPIKMDNIYPSHVGPYVGDDVFPVANYTLVNRFSGDLNSLTPKCIPAGTKNSRSEGFQLAKHKHTNIPTMMCRFPL